MSLNPSQQAAVDSNAPRILCIASPGSGKTRTLVARIQRLINAGVPPAEICVVTFTRNAAREIESRLESPTSLGYCGTLHGLMVRLIERAGDKVTVLDEEQAKDLRRQSAEALGYKGTEKVLDEAEGDVKLIDTFYDSRTYTSSNVAILVIQHFHRMLVANNLWTFDRLLNLEGPVITQAAGFTHLLVDEFQDSADADAAIYEALPIENKFFVGDPRQSIFKFRGGSVENIMSLMNDERCEVHYLNQNYRCGEAICNAANELIGASLDCEMIPATPLDCIVGARCFPTSKDEDNALIARCTAAASGCLGQTAVLVRTNKLVDKYTALLSGAGLRVSRRVQDVQPPDMAKAKKLLAVLNDPENDAVAYWWLKESYGDKKAQSIKLDAQAAGKSINRAFLHLPTEGLDVEAIPEALSRARIGSETIQTVLAACQGAKTVQDVLMTLAGDGEEAKMTDGDVTVSTIHGAKGREWDTVILPAFEQEIIPGVSKSVDVEEERRLAYVAFTRARTTLLISYCRTRPPMYGGGAPVEVKPSQFIREAGLGEDAK